MSLFTVAFQGERGAYSEAAALSLFGEQIQPIPCPTFDQVFEGAERGEYGRGLVPIENSLAGSIHRNYDLLLRHNLHIVGEINLRVVHTLIALPGVSLAGIGRIYSHPQALAQCENTLDRRWPGIERVPTYDTAGSAKLIREQGLTDVAAIASRHAAQVYGLDILAEGIEDDPENYTRFLVLSRRPEIPDSGPAKTSIVYAMDNAPGVLFKSLSVFALRDIDLTKIESRPVPGRLWEYLFYIDLAGSTAEARLTRALDNLGEYALMLRILGSYPTPTETDHEEEKKQ